MDEIARRYLLLVLRLERAVAGLVDSYVGPPEIRAEALGGPQPDPEALADEADRLRSEAAALPGDDAPAERRRSWFDGQLRSLAAQARAAAGSETPYADLVEELFGIPLAPYAEADLLRMRARLDGALPGRGTLDERVAAFRDRLAVPAGRTIEALQHSAARFAEATRRDFWLPDDEAIIWEEARDRPWGAYAEFLGRGRTAIRINLDLPRDVTIVAFLAAHEAYPGHHAEHVVKEQTLVGEGLGEATLRTMNTPEAVLSEGQADLAREVVMGDWELEAELRRIGRHLGLDADWAAAVAVRRARDDLQAATSAAALLMHRDGAPEDDVRAFLREFTAQPPEQIEHSMRVLRDPVGRTYVLTYTEGVRLIRPWLELHGQTAGFARLLSEQLSPAVLRSELSHAGMGADGAHAAR